jgi:hypothetical protein
MPVDEATFVAGVGILMTLEVAVLAISVQNARRIGTDKRARELADQAHDRVSRHLRRDHDMYTRDESKHE